MIHSKHFVKWIEKTQIELQLTKVFDNGLIRLKFASLNNTTEIVFRTFLSRQDVFDRNNNMN